MSRYCWKHIPTNLRAGGGFNGYAEAYGHGNMDNGVYGYTDSGGLPAAYPGEFAQSPDGCADCAALAAADDAIPTPTRHWWCPVCKLVECECGPK